MLKTNTNTKTRKWWTWLRDIVLFVLIFTAISMWQARDMLSTDGSTVVAQQNLVSLDGNVAPLLATDKANLIYFFAPWCQVCSHSIGNLEYLNPDKVNVVVIALDYASQEDVAAFIAKHDVNSRVFLGHSRLKQQFQIKGYPSYYMLDENQKVVSSSYGYSTALGLKLREVFGG